VSGLVSFAPEAEAQLASIYRYIAGEASPEVARTFTDQIVSKCESLALFPHRGAPHDDVRPGLRTVPFRRRVTIAYSVQSDRVTILGLFYAGQDFRSLLAPD
jgi:toxin ParE1/3/4